ncbi:MAG: phosphatase PAP2 family protein [Pseudacidovorax sp.]|uniref:phosphatase PAP2 family protein n=1 Tax=Pseudacidovorax sp. TaxID=1934311 RepID=UPI001B46EE7E|nr:phosphatase PAP2 family protein [Pseudacidovorax sp.]MBP6898330.1 phosphatase PAP2 family protein [Pseudacidovorax sp.]MBP6901065.1 phosphatase PAP2 family protein [Burkholderiaceae bacterium]
MGDLLWPAVTRLGEAQLLLPAMALALLALARRPESRALAGTWLATTALAALLTTATKLAFIGWGLGLASLDFTGISGHAMFSAAILPPLLVVLAQTLRPHARVRSGWALGLALAAMVAVSRVAVGAHSWSEVIAGFALGTAASVLARLAGPLPRTPFARWPAVALLACVPLAVAWAPPSRTHDWVTQLALTASGRTTPHLR